MRENCKLQYRILELDICLDYDDCLWNSDCNIF